MQLQLLYVNQVRMMTYNDTESKRMSSYDVDLVINTLPLTLQWRELKIGYLGDSSSNVHKGGMPNFSMSVFFTAEVSTRRVGWDPSIGRSPVHPIWKPPCHLLTGQLYLPEYWLLLRYVWVSHNTVWCHYNTVNFLTNIHKTHPIARPLGI